MVQYVDLEELHYFKVSVTSILTVPRCLGISRKSDAFYSCCVSPSLRREPAARQPGIRHCLTRSVAVRTALHIGSVIIPSPNRERGITSAASEHFPMFVVSKLRRANQGHLPYLVPVNCRDSVGPGWNTAIVRQVSPQNMSMEALPGRFNVLWSRDVVMLTIALYFMRDDRWKPIHGHHLSLQ